MEFTDSQQKEISKLTTSINRAKDNLEREEETRRSIGLTYQQKRVEKKLTTSKKTLEELTMSYSKKREQLEVDYRTALLRLEEEECNKRKEIETDICTCEEVLEKDNPAVIRAKVLLDIAYKNRANYIEECARLVAPRTRVTLPPSSNLPPSGREEEARRVLQAAAEQREKEELEERKREAQRVVRERERVEEEKRLKDLEVLKQQREEQQRMDLDRWSKQREVELSSNTRPQEAAEEEEEEEDEWDISGMSEAYIPKWLQSCVRDGKVIPSHLQHYLEPQKKKSSPPEEDVGRMPHPSFGEVIIPEEELSPAPPKNSKPIPLTRTTTILPPPRPQTLSNQEVKRKPVKQLKGFHSYSLPIE